VGLGFFRGGTSFSTLPLPKRGGAFSFQMGKRGGGISPWKAITRK